MLVLFCTGLCKIPGTCSAFISATENIDTLEVVVEYCQYHTGHSMDISHLRMSHELRTEIAGLLNKGETIAKVLDTVRGKMNSDDTKLFDRSQLLRRLIHVHLLNLNKALKCTIM